MSLVASRNDNRRPAVAVILSTVSLTSQARLEPTALRV